MARAFYVKTLCPLLFHCCLMRRGLVEAENYKSGLYKASFWPRGHFKPSSKKHSSGYFCWELLNKKVFLVKIAYVHLFLHSLSSFNFREVVLVLLGIQQLSELVCRLLASADLSGASHHQATTSNNSPFQSLLWCQDRISPTSYWDSAGETPRFTD